MFPIVAIGGVIGAVVSIAEGVSWLSDQLDSSKSTVSVGGKSDSKSDATSTSEATTSQFEATLAAQVAGQKQPVVAASTASTASTGSTVATMTGPTYDTVARMKAGLIAYSQVGEHRDDQSRGEVNSTAGS